MKIVVATHNEGKLPEILTILNEALGDKAGSVELVSAGALKLPDVKETGVTFEENALLKARDVAERTGLPALADDSGLIVDVMGRAPGILSARWAGKHGDDQANTALLLNQLSDIPDDLRQARFRCAAALAVPQTQAFGGSEDWLDETGEMPRQPVSAVKFDETVATGEMTGRIVREPRGSHGFGYDPIFVPDVQPGRVRDGRAKPPLTSAEMSAEVKNSISHRRRAFEALAPSVVRLLEAELWDQEG